MPNFDAPYLEWTDSVGLARLTAFVPRLTGFTPDVDPKGPRHAALGDGTSYQFLFRTDYVVKFTLPNVPAWQLTELLRLKAWLISGGVVTVYTADGADRTYTLKIREATTPEIRFVPDDMEYAIDLELVNVSAAPVVAMYEGAALLLTPDTDYLALGGTFVRATTATYMTGP